MRLQGWKTRIPAQVEVTQDGDYAVEIKLTAKNYEFWRSVQPNGADIRITDSDGVSLLKYQRVEWNYEQQEATLQVETLHCDKAGRKQFFIYCGNPKADDIASSFTVDNPLFAKVNTFYVVDVPFIPVVCTVNDRTADIKVYQNESPNVVVDFRRLPSEIDTVKVVVKDSEGTDVTAQFLRDWLVIDKFVMLKLKAQTEECAATAYTTVRFYDGSEFIFKIEISVKAI